MKAPPKTTEPGFPEALATWIEESPLSERELERLTGVSRKQLKRWKDWPGPGGAEPKGTAAKAWNAFAEGTLATELSRQRDGLAERIKKLLEISWDRD